MLLLGSSQANEPHEALSEVGAEHTLHHCPLQWFQLYLYIERQVMSSSLALEEYIDALPCFSSVRQKDLPCGICSMGAMIISSLENDICAINY